MAGKKPTALTIGFDFAEGLLESCGGDFSPFGELIHNMLAYANQDGEEHDEPDFKAGSLCAILWPMARNQVLHSLYSYNERVRKNAIGGKKNSTEE